MALRRALRVLLALALLAAQQLAMSHAIAHLEREGLPAEHKPLCDQHGALATVAGVLGCAAPPPAAVVPAPPDSFVCDLPVVPGQRRAPSSRGPPPLL